MPGEVELVWFRFLGVCAVILGLSYADYRILVSIGVSLGLMIIWHHRYSLFDQYANLTARYGQPMTVARITGVKTIFRKIGTELCPWYYQYTIDNKVSFLAIKQPVLGAALPELPLPEKIQIVLVDKNQDQDLDLDRVLFRMEGILQAFAGPYMDFRYGLPELKTLLELLSLDYEKYRGLEITINSPTWEVFVIQEPPHPSAI